ncbi:MAG: hypothetical protein EA396_14755 [Anaerolineaceae bacterium]|nr:MAG: hypothetical protein EA396_14755 [Anaerolineaceae bacterium]
MRLTVCVIFILCLGVMTVYADDADDDAPAEPTAITLSYFNAVDDTTFDRYMMELMFGLLDYDLELQIVDYDADDPMVHVLLQPATSRDDQRDNVTYMLNLLQTPFSELSHGIAPTLTERAVIFSADPVPSATFTLSILLMLIEDCENAVKLYDDLEVASSSPIWRDHLIFHRGHCSLLDEEYASAVTYFQSVLYAPTGDYYWASALNLSYAYLFNEQPHEARAMLAAIGQDLPVWSTQYSEVMTRRAALYVALDDMPAALESIAAAFTVDQLYRPAFYQRGVILAALGDTDAARDDMLMYLELLPRGIYAEQAQDFLDNIGG